MDSKRVPLHLALCLAICLLVGGVLVMAATKTSAADVPESITLSPTSKHYQLKAGTATHDELTVVNDGKTDYIFRVYADPYSVRDENYEPDFSSLRQNTTIPEWTDFEKDSYFIKAGDTVTVKYTVTVPANATPGGHYGVLFAETQPTDAPAGNSIARKKRVGAIVYATVDGTYEVGGKLVEQSVPVLQFVAPLETLVRVENTGNTDFPTTSGVLVTDVFGGKKYEASKVYQVLPGSTRKITMAWPQSPGFGLFKVVSSVEFLDQHYTKNAYVLVAPVWLYLLAVLAVLGGVIFLVQQRR